MSKSLPPSDSTPSIQDLYPKFSPEQQVEAEETLTQYADLLVRMVERRAAEREWTARGSDGTRNSKEADMGP